MNGPHAGTPPAARSPHRRYRCTGQTDAGWGGDLQRPLKSRPQSVRASPTGQRQRPAGTPAQLSRTDTQRSDTGGSKSAISLRQASQLQPPFLDFFLGPLLGLRRYLLLHSGQNLADRGPLILGKRLGRKLPKRLFQIVRVLGFENHNIVGRLGGLILSQGKIHAVFFCTGLERSNVGLGNLDVGEGDPMLF